MQALQLILSLSLIVLIHELGHFTFAKLFKTRVDKFYLFFNPWFSLFKYKKGETTYGLGWLPLGGYCKIAGMVDESMDKEQMKKPAEKWEYRSKTLGQRFLIISGGVIFNFILAFIIYASVLYVWGERYLEVKNAEYGVYCDSLALDAGLQHGDKIVLVGNVEPEVVSDVIKTILFDGATTITVNRNGYTQEITLPEDLSAKLMQSQNHSFVHINMPFIVKEVMAGSPASKTDLQVGDRIIGLDTIGTEYFYDFKKVATAFSGKETTITVERDGSEQQLNITLTPNGTIGVWPMFYDELFEMTDVTYSFLQSIPAGISSGVDNLTAYIKQIPLIFTKEGASQTGSFYSMAKAFPEQWNWYAFWMLTAFFSVVIGFMNILPIPALDGGHLLFLAYELFTGKKPTDKFLEKAQMIGMTIVLGLFLFAIMNDFGRIFS